MHISKPIKCAMFGAATILLAACNQTTEMASAPSGNWSAVSNKHWQLISIDRDGDTVTPMAPVFATIKFDDDGKISGSTGCNRYFGTYQRSANGLKVSPLGSTRMMCVDAAMIIEDSFGKAMTDIDGWNVADGNLRLVDDSGKTVLTFIPIGQ